MTERQFLLYLREKRIEQGFSIREAADRAKLLPSTIWRIETGKSQAYFTTVLFYAHSLGIDLDIKRLE